MTEIPKGLKNRVFVFHPKSGAPTTVAYFTTEGNVIGVTPPGDETSVNLRHRLAEALDKASKIEDREKRLAYAADAIGAIRDEEARAMVDAIGDSPAAAAYEVEEWSVSTRNGVRSLMEHLAKHEFASHKDCLAEFATALRKEGVEGAGVPCTRCGAYDDDLHVDFSDLVDGTDPERIYCRICAEELRCLRCKRFSLAEPGYPGLAPDERLAQDAFGICIDCWDVMKKLLADDTEICGLSKALCNAGSKCDEKTWKVPEDVVKYVKWKTDEGWPMSKSVNSVLFQFAVDFGNTFARIPRWVAESAFLVWLDLHLSGQASIKPDLDYESRLRSEVDIRITTFANMVKETMTK